ncbi:hypothetical protein TNCV_736461 [Trichonephila clavipes]|nr:hypothetical protein TNCV_736461 [Trichonephila clavipes]
MLIDFAANNNRLLPSALLQHKCIHKISWRSPDGSACDPLWVDSRRKSDACTYRGAHQDSDDFLFMARISIFRKSRGKFDCGQFKDKALKLKFQEQLENKYKVINIFIDEDSIDKKWNTLKETIIETGNQVVEKVKKKSKRSYFDNDIVSWLQRRKMKHIVKC